MIVPADAASGDAPCPGFVDVPGQGPSCPLSTGGWEVLLGDGTRMPTHGPDPAPAGGAAGPVGTYLDVSPPEVPPTCAAAGTYVGHAIYARPTGTADNYASRLAGIRKAIHQANGVLRMDGAELGRSLSFEMRCTGAGDVLVDNVVLPINAASDTFSTITTALRNAGYTSITEKYWVFYDDAVACGCSGQGTIYLDDRLVAENYNNGATGSSATFAIAYSSRYFTYSTIMHEAGHNLGAVQTSAPRTTGAGGYHCTDGQDIMCYADSGPKGGSYSSSVCTDRTYFDCGHNDYFHTNPPAGSYLATKWNIGSTLDRFLDFSTGCDYTKTASLTIGLLGATGEGTSSRTYSGIPSGCWGAKFSLNGEDPNLGDMDLCWLNGATVLSCAESAGPEVGTVPSGTTGVRVTSFVGAQPKFWLSLG